MTCAQFFICREQMHASEANHHTDERIKPPPDENPRLTAAAKTAIDAATRSVELTLAPDSNNLAPLDHSPADSCEALVETSGGVP